MELWRFNNMHSMCEVLSPALTASQGMHCCKEREMAQCGRVLYKHEDISSDLRTRIKPYTGVHMHICNHSTHKDVTDKKDS